MSAPRTKDQGATLSINRCPTHGSFWSVSLDCDGSGRRLTDSRCCGQWHSVAAWPVDPAKMIGDIAKAAGLTVRVSKVRK